MASETQGEDAGLRLSRRPWQLEAAELAAELGTDPEAGLAREEAARRLGQHGPNRLREKKGRGPVVLFLRQFNNFMVWVLVGAAAVSAGLALFGEGGGEEWIDAAAITGIVILNAVLGFIQEHRAEKALAALRRMVSPSCRAVRGGEHELLPAAELVPGDLIELEAGDAVPADCRLSWATAGFAVQEASLTGESVAAAKSAAPLVAAEVPLGDRANMVFMGTSAAGGKARAVVVATGMDTELGRIAGMLETAGREETPLQRRLERFGKGLVWLCLGLVAVVFAMGMLHRESLVSVFMGSVSLAVAVIPEGLPAVVTIALALGVQRMVRRHALIRKLPSVETLGCSTVICSDKTGTLTRNEMTVQAVYAGGRLYEVSGAGYAPRGDFRLDGRAVDPLDQPDLHRALVAGALCNGARLVDEAGAWRVLGDPTEGAILTAAAKAGLFKKELQDRCPFVEEIPFDSERKKMTVLRRGEGGAVIAYVKGAPDVLLGDCAALVENGRVRPLSDEDRRRVLEVNAELAGRAMRVLAVAWREMSAPPERPDAASVERELVFGGLVAMIDPPREEVKEAMRLCKAAGIRTVMITGDHRDTAVAVARELGFFRSDSLALTGEELDRLSDEELGGAVERVAVYARVAPEHKLRIVRAWRERGEVVAMTGDGVNDAPAVKEADIGVAMGITGTDVTKEVSDMVVTDDNFASIVAAVEEGRAIYDNIRKFVHYLLSCNCGEMLVMLAAALAGLPVPLWPIQILWVNLVTDGLPALALGVDPASRDIMRRPPRSTSEGIVNRRTVLLILYQGVQMAACSLAAFLLVRAWTGSVDAGRTAAFTVLACVQLVQAFNCRSQSESLFRLGVFSNSKLVLACLASLALQLGVVLLPGVREVFKAETLSAGTWLLIAALSTVPLWSGEVRKLVARNVKSQK